METDFWELSRGEIYLFLLLAIIIFLLFRVLNRSLPFISVRKKWRKVLLNYLPVIEMAAWFVYIIWAIQYLWEGNRLYALELSIILSLFVLAVSWFSLRDFIAGAVFKASGRFLKNETVKIGEYAGRITGFESRNLILETEKGETIYIPYNKVLGTVIVKSHPAENVLSHTFRLKLNDISNSMEVMNRLKISILTSPWSSLKKDPQIRLIDSEDKSVSVFEITVYAIEEEYFVQLEKYIRSLFLKSTPL